MSFLFFSLSAAWFLLEQLYAAMGYSQHHPIFRKEISANIFLNVILHFCISYFHFKVILSKSSYIFVKFDMFSSAALDQAFKSAYQGQDVQIWSERAKLWLKKLTVLQQTNPFSEQSSDNLLQVDQLSDDELPIWLAAQRAVTRYEGILSPIGPRGRLLRKFLIWSGLISPMPRESFDLESDVTTSEPYLRLVLLSQPPFLQLFSFFAAFCSTWDRKNSIPLCCCKFYYHGAL